VLWYAWQHNASQLLIVTSFTWKAALLLGTPSNPGYSTTMLFGTNRGDVNKRTPGTSPKSQHLLNASVRIILHDEISFDNQEHFGVSEASSIEMGIVSATEWLLCNDGTMHGQKHVAYSRVEQRNAAWAVKHAAWVRVLSVPCEVAGNIVTCYPSRSSFICR
jgi:hypothetical protein